MLATRGADAGSTQVEIPAGGHERLYRLGRDARHTLDAIGCAVVTIVPVQLGHGGDMLFGVRWQAQPGEASLPPVQRHIHVRHWTIERPSEGCGQLRHVDRPWPR